MYTIFQFLRVDQNGNPISVPEQVPEQNSQYYMFKQIQVPQGFSHEQLYTTTQERNIDLCQKKIKKPTNQIKFNEMKNFLPKTEDSQQQDDSSSANSCLKSNESWQLIKLASIYQSSNQQMVQLVQQQPFPQTPQFQQIPLPKLKQDIISAEPKDITLQKQKGNKQLVRKPKNENVNTGHWSQEEHNTYLQFLSQYESIMSSSSMKKTSKIFKQMSELIGSRTPSQCRSHHQKFNPYAARGEFGKRLTKTDRNRAGRKKKNEQKIIYGEIRQNNIEQSYNSENMIYFNNELGQVQQLEQQYNEQQFQNEDSKANCNILDQILKSPKSQSIRQIDNYALFLNDQNAKPFELLL